MSNKGPIHKGTFSGRRIAYNADYVHRDDRRRSHPPCDLPECSEQECGMRDCTPRAAGVASVEPGDAAAPRKDETP